MDPLIPVLLSANVNFKRRKKDNSPPVSDTAQIIVAFVFSSLFGAFIIYLSVITK